MKKSYQILILLLSCILNMVVVDTLTTSFGFTKKTQLMVICLCTFSLIFLYLVIYLIGLVFKEYNKSSQIPKHHIKFYCTFINTCEFSNGYVVVYAFSASEARMLLRSNSTRHWIFLKNVLDDSCNLESELFMKKQLFSINLRT